MSDKREKLRMIPSINEIAEHPDMVSLIHHYGREQILHMIRSSVDSVKEQLVSEKIETAFSNMASRQDLLQYILEEVNRKIIHQNKKELQPVVNATGIVLHTNLGRAPLPSKALEVVYKVAEGYSNVEYDLNLGQRGSRHQIIENILCEITGAEAAMVVNNNAAGVFLCLNTLALHKDVIVSRGQQVEIGGSFRIPDIISRSGGHMVEVGTTNKTHVYDYEEAIGESTAILMKIHTSNFRMVGFTEEVSLEEMVKLGEKHHLLVVEDLGSGSLMDLTPFGFPHEPTVTDSIKKGADLVLFSGDKLLGGPQAGLVVGKKYLVDKIKKNPLARMVRVDKMTLAALQEVLRIYQSKEALTGIPVLRMLTKNLHEMEQEAQALKTILEQVSHHDVDIDIVDENDETGGGAFPGIELRGKAISLALKDQSVNGLQKHFLYWNPPIITRIQNDRLLLSLRTLDKNAYSTIALCLEDFLRRSRI